MSGIRAAVVTVSDGVSKGTRADGSGDAAEALLREAGFDVEARTVLPDERPAIETTLRDLADARGFALVVTTGGTGFGPRDVTPEATLAVLEREAPGLAELMRRDGLRQTPMAALSRAVAGSRGATLDREPPRKPEGRPREPRGPAARLAARRRAARRPGGGAPDGSRRRRRVEAAAPAVVGSVEAKAVKVHGSPPCAVGNSMRIVPGGEVHGTLGCAEFDEAAVRDAAEILASGEPGIRTYHHELGDVEVYLEPSRRAPALVVVSATDVARELARLAPGLGFAPILVETRPERVTDADANSMPVARELGDVEIDAETRLVFTDHDAPGIAAALAGALRSPARFIGVMGSRRHVGPYVEELRSMGFGDEELARIRSPLGLDLGGRRPAEVALSIAAGLVADEHDRAAGWLDR